ncbi:MAG: hypothetical protein R3F50_19245 [Gammaproteobacteria bacterium]
MEIVLVFCTVLGGIAALWYFWEKIFPKTEPTIEQPQVIPPISAEPTRERIEQAILDSNPQEDWNRTGDINRSVISYNRDHNLRFEVHYTDEGKQNADFKEPWANRHPDQHATGYWCNLYYGATLIERFILVSVDGGRAMLPIPKDGEDGMRPDRILPLDYRIAQIHDTIGNLDEYIRRSDLHVSASAP